MTSRSLALCSTSAGFLGRVIDTADLTTASTTPVITSSYNPVSCSILLIAFSYFISTDDMGPTLTDYPPSDSEDDWLPVSQRQNLISSPTLS